MNQPKTKTTREAQTVKSFDVSDLSVEQRRELFADCLCQGRFRGFVRNEQNQQVHYVFHYQK